MVTMVARGKQRKVVGDSGEHDLVKDGFRKLLYLAVANRNSARWLLTCVLF